MSERTESTPNASMTTTKASAGRSDVSRCETGKPPSAPGNADDAMKLPVQLIAQRALDSHRQLAKRQENRQIATRSHVSLKAMRPMTDREYGESMLKIQALRQTLQLTPEQQDGWRQVLAVFSKDVFVTAAMKVVLGGKEWPDLRDFYLMCRDVARQKGYTDSGLGVGATVTNAEAEEAAQRMGLLEYGS